MPLTSLGKTLWKLLPLSLRQSRIAFWVKSKLGLSQSVPASGSQSGVTKQQTIKTITTLDELDLALQALDALAAISDDELRRGFTLFQMRFPLEVHPDPDSALYRTNQFKLYEWLYGKPYSINHEATHFEIHEAATRPYPFHTQGAQTVGNHLIGIGHLIRNLNLKPGSTILEFGPGWGNTTICLARMGFKVTAIDIERNFVELIKERARRKGLTIETIQGDFSVISTLGKKFDAVLFFECFHHCSDHQALISKLEQVVVPGGKVVFGAEPITDDFPLPWGLRLDGESLWAIRKHGWLELGFKESYFRNLLAKHGWTVEKTICPETPWGVIFTAIRANQDKSS